MVKSIKNKAVAIFLLFTPFISLAQYKVPVGPDPMKATLNLFNLSFGNVFRWAVLIILFFTVAQFFYKSKEENKIKSKKEIFCNIFFSTIFLFMISYEIFNSVGLPVGCGFLANTIINCGLVLYFVFYSIFQINFWFIGKKLNWDKILLIICLVIYLAGIYIKCV